MAARLWIRLPGGRLKRWTKGRTDKRHHVPPHEHRNMWNRIARRRLRQALLHGEAHAFPYVHQREAGWYW